MGKSYISHTLQTAVKSCSLANNESSITFLRRKVFGGGFWLNCKTEGEQRCVWCGQWSGLAERKRPVTPNGKTANGKVFLKAGIGSAARYTKCFSGSQSNASPAVALDCSSPQMVLSQSANRNHYQKIQLNCSELLRVVCNHFGD